MTDTLLTLAAANLAAAVAVALVLVLRAPARKLFGPRIAYGLWLLVPLAAAGMLLPARVQTVAVRAAPPGDAAAAPQLAQAGASSPEAAPFEVWPLIAGLWVAGILANLAWIGWRQAQFARDAEAGLAGPAAVGVLRPRVVTPSDFGRRYSAREQFVVLAHEETHIARHDTRINALVAAARCVNWFNPMLHLASRLLRIDQELACDAQVIAEHPKVRRSYAEAMLKTQLATRPLPLGCYWLPAQAHPLAERIRLLSRAAPDPRQQALGFMLLTALTLAAMGSAWSVKPARVEFIQLPTATLPATPALARIRAAETPPLARMSNRVAAPAAPAPVIPPAPGGALAQAHADAQSAPNLRERDRPRWAYERGAEPRPQPDPRPEPRSERPPRRIFAAAGRSSVEPGSAVRLVATSMDAEGRPLMTDLTSFGSQRYFRTGTYIADGSRERLFTAVTQRGERLWVTASLSKRFRPEETATVEMRAGETRTFTLPNGRPVVVTPTLRAETAAEMDGARGIFDATAAELSRTSDDAWRSYRDRCRTESC
ncbi:MULTISPECIES: M56 family metallopeptidase [unclassified Phenylobacterium]|uniref:M56 family metallopeptidase n=1 Tax=unclassified Phenylobacterium TaxID=2640670 RepID=UPI00083AC513|nr:MULTISPECIES: M56 family metallopeptidase [unclassified Phenylobacterium]